MCADDTKQCITVHKNDVATYKNTACCKNLIDS